MSRERDRIPEEGGEAVRLPRRQGLPHNTVPFTAALQDLFGLPDETVGTPVPFDLAAAAAAGLRCPVLPEYAGWVRTALDPAAYGRTLLQPLDAGSAVTLVDTSGLSRGFWSLAQPYLAATGRKTDVLRALAAVRSGELPAASLDDCGLWRIEAGGRSRFSVREPLFVMAYDGGGRIAQLRKGRWSAGRRLTVARPDDVLEVRSAADAALSFMTVPLHPRLFSLLGDL